MYNWVNPTQAKYASSEKGKQKRKAANNRFRTANREKRRLECENWRRKYPIRAMISQVKGRAKREGIECTLGQQDWDLPMPEVCPILGITLIYAGKGLHPGTASIDRIDSSKGYTRDNIMIISVRANTLKSDATIDEVRSLLSFMERR